MDACSGKRRSSGSLPPRVVPLDDLPPSRPPPDLGGRSEHFVSLHSLPPEMGGKGRGRGADSEEGEDNRAPQDEMRPVLSFHGRGGGVVRGARGAATFNGRLLLGRCTLALAASAYLLVVACGSN